MKEQLLIELWKKPGAQSGGMSGKKTLTGLKPHWHQELFLDSESFINCKIDTRFLWQHVEVTLVETKMLKTFHFFHTIKQQFSSGKWKKDLCKKEQEIYTYISDASEQRIARQLLPWWSIQYVSNGGTKELKANAEQCQIFAKEKAK